MSSEQAIETLTADEFRAYAGSAFRLSMAAPDGLPPVYVELKLDKVTQFAGYGPDGVRAPFSLVLHGPLAPVLPQAIYPLAHEQLGLLELFVVPIGPQEPTGPGHPPAMRYEVVFG